MAKYDFIGAIILLIGTIFVIWFLFFRNRTGKDGLNIKEIQFNEVTYNGMSDKIKKNGIDIKKGKLVMSHNVIGGITKIHEFSGKGFVKEFDPNTGILTETDEEVEYEFMAFKLNNKNKILSALGLKSQIYLINKKEITGIRFDPENRTWFLPQHIDFFSYGNIWIADDVSKEYVRKFALSFFDESVQTGLMNQPNRIIALDTDQSKKINIIKTASENEIRKYDKTKQGTETTVLT